VDNLDLPPETVVSLAEKNLDRFRLAGNDARGAYLRDADGSKVVLK
jgi:hypothetical protein